MQFIFYHPKKEREHISDCIQVIQSHLSVDHILQIARFVTSKQASKNSMGTDTPVSDLQWYKNNF